MATKQPRKDSRLEQKDRREEAFRTFCKQIESEPDWRQLMLDLRNAGITSEWIATQAGFNPATARHYTSARFQGARGPNWRLGTVILAAHRQYVGYR
jgi:hypothetical protein